jgi:DNA-binding CsgD family transcriptional regulator
MVNKTQQLYHGGREMRRLLYVGDSAAVERIAAGCGTLPPMYLGDIGESPLAGLIMLEIRRIEAWTRMSTREKAILECDFHGCTNAEIADVFGMTVAAVASELYRLRRKIKTYPHRGLLTVLVEECGWDGVQELLADSQLKQ